MPIKKIIALESIASIILNNTIIPFIILKKSYLCTVGKIFFYIDRFA